ncbi:unnamed protein product [Ectocarpus sp. 4 AP-2014]
MQHNVLLNMKFQPHFIILRPQDVSTLYNDRYHKGIRCMLDDVPLHCIAGWWPCLRACLFVSGLSTVCLFLSLIFGDVHGAVFLDGAVRFNRTAPHRDISR